MSCHFHDNVHLERIRRRDMKNAQHRTLGLTSPWLNVVRTHSDTIGRCFLVLLYFLKITFKVAYGGNPFDSVFLRSYEISVFTKYVLPESCFDGEYTKLSKCTRPTGCKYLGVKNRKTNA